MKVPLRCYCTLTMDGGVTTTTQIVHRVANDLQHDAVSVLGRDKLICRVCRVESSPYQPSESWNF